MRIRRTDTTGDATFGASAANFWRDSPDGVAQAVIQRMRLWKGDWFLDRNDGLDWTSRVLGTNTQGLYDMTIRERILGTQGVLSILSYASQRNGETRALAVQVTIDTIYGTVQFPIEPPRVFVYPPVPPPARAAPYLLGPDGQNLDGLAGDKLEGNAS